MEFREFFREQERMDESLWGVAKGLGNTFAGAMTMGDEALAKLMGDGTRGRFARGSGRFGRGIRQVFIGEPTAKPQQKDPARQEVPNQEAQPKPQEEKVSFRCQNGHRLNAPARLAGQKAKCPKCSATVRIPDPRERPQPRPQVRAPLKGEPTPHENYVKLSGNYETAKKNNNQGVMRHIQYLMSLADPVYYHYALEQGYFSGKRKS